MKNSDLSIINMYEKKYKRKKFKKFSGDFHTSQEIIVIPFHCNTYRELMKLGPVENKKP